ncbi:hypothetical protein BKP37_01450 [Anaerobacillus alkalilacustris]|uniref:Lipoprotein n=1 Tax=Anaerobacillus alkalilacustris TaxID=393763 RepID=A0A1S2LXI6_9BACI|nr:hypothetical protein [Anaerobacillus alkalilacustris]OIJ17222.1 hypothetical protein BKP37_01450 [Anaerobacillus alkalilacustris]
MKSLLILFLIIITLSACNNEQQLKMGEEEQLYIGSPTANEILSKNKREDIFLMNEVVYVNAEKIDWVKKADLTLGNAVFEVVRQSNDGEDFTEGTATKLPVGTKIYKTNEKGDIYIAVVDGREIRYLGFREG